MADHSSFSSVAPFRVIDLFAGCGGLSEGFRQTGRFTPVAAVENDLFAAATYAANFGVDHVYFGDIADWVQGELPPADVVIGGPPCQGFSNLGTRRKDDARNDLWEWYVDTLVKVTPKAFLLENVPPFLDMPQFAKLQAELSHGRLSNYAIDFKILAATDFGAEQLRRRAIVIGTHKDLEKIPVPDAQVPRHAWRTVKHAFGDLDPKIPKDHIDLPSGRESSIFGSVAPGPYATHELHVTRRYTELSRKRFAHIPTGGNRFDLPDDLKAPCWRKHTTGSGDVMGRLVWDRPSVTIRTEFFKPEKGRYLHPDEPRAISHLEAARLQGFPDDFNWYGSKVEIAKQIGNAVPIPLARALAWHIASGLSSA